MHAYDVHYGTVRRGQDAIVALDDSIVRGNTLKNAILRTLDKMGPTQIVVVSSCPQIRYPDVYGIDMAKLGDLAAFKAAIGLMKDRGMEHILDDVYKMCREELKAPLKAGHIVNHVQRIYEPFTPEEISLRISTDVKPADCRAEVHVLYQSVEDLHKALPDHSGDWYFTGDYPTPGGARVCCRAFALWMEGSTQRCYGIHSALSFLRARRPALVLGSGGREHALAWKLSKSAEVSVVFVAPGNGGIGNSYGQAEPFDASPMVNVDLPITGPDFADVISFCRQHDVGVVVVGPEQMLADGVADKLREEDIPVFGPSKAAAQIEASKSFAKDFMKRHKIPTAKYQTFTSGGLDAALKYIDSVSFDVVVKASGLAAGKGVIVPESKEEAKQAARDCISAASHGLHEVFWKYTVNLIQFVYMSSRVRKSCKIELQWHPPITQSPLSKCCLLRMNSLPFLRLGLEKKVFGEAGQEVVIEERLLGHILSPETDGNDTHFTSAESNVFILHVNVNRAPLDHITM